MIRQDFIFVIVYFDQLAQSNEVVPADYLFGFWICELLNDLLHFEKLQRITTCDNFIRDNRVVVWFIFPRSFCNDILTDIDVKERDSWREQVSDPNCSI